MASMFDRIQEKNSGDTRVKGKVVKEENDDSYYFTVHVWTRVNGRFETGNGTATYVMFGEGDKVVSTMTVGEHASTDAIHNSDEDHNSESREYRKAYYDANVMSGALVVNARQISQTPSNPGEVIEWLKDVGGEELRTLRSEALKEGKGAIREGAGIIVEVFK